MTNSAKTESKFNVGDAAIVIIENRCIRVHITKATWNSEFSLWTYAIAGVFTLIEDDEADEADLLEAI